MPCRDYESDRYESPTDSWQYKEMKDQANRLARIACKAMTALEVDGHADLLLLADDEVREWWEKHKEADRKAQLAREEKARKERIRREALARLSEEEKAALGLLKTKKKVS